MRLLKNLRWALPRSKKNGGFRKTRPLKCLALPWEASRAIAQARFKKTRHTPHHPARQGERKASNASTNTGGHWQSKSRHIKTPRGYAPRGGGTSMDSTSAAPAQQPSRAQRDKRNGPHTTAARAPNIQRGIGCPAGRNMPYMTAQITAQISLNSDCVLIFYFA